MILRLAASALLASTLLAHAAGEAEPAPKGAAVTVLKASKFCFPNNVGHDIWMSRGDIATFRRIFRQTKKERRVMLSSRLTFAVRSTRNEMGFVGSLANRPQLVVPVVEQHPACTRPSAGQTRAEINTVDDPV